MLFGAAALDSFTVMHLYSVDKALDKLGGKLLRLRICAYQSEENVNAL